MIFYNQETEIFDVFQNFLETVEHCQAILMSGTPHYTEGKLLSVPIVADITGLSQVGNHIWSQRSVCEESVIGLGFNKSSTNTKRTQGAAVWMESVLGQPILLLECHHHVLEFIVGAVAITLLGRTTAPTDPLFQQLKRLVHFLCKVKLGHMIFY